MPDLLLAAGIVFALNLLPAFAPPTWMVLVALRLSTDVPAAALVVVGAACATAGRTLLALGARRLRGRFSAERIASLEALRAELEGHRAATTGGFLVFLISPLPAAQLFIAAGITGLRLAPLAAAFFCGRLVTYSLYVGAAGLVERGAGEILAEPWRSPEVIALNLLMIGLLVALVKVDWIKVIARVRSRRSRSA